jgi:hypothetical protein
MQKERAMTSAITITFPPGTTFNATTASLTLGDGSIDLTATSAQLAGAFNFSAFIVANTEVVFSNNATGASVNGVVTIPVSPDGANPAISGSGFTGIAQVMWPVKGVPNYGNLSSGGGSVPLTGLT